MKDICSTLASFKADNARSAGGHGKYEEPTRDPDVWQPAPPRDPDVWPPPTPVEHKYEYTAFIFFHDIIIIIDI